MFCKIINPEVLSFQGDAEKNIFTAEAEDLLIVENRALGYHLSIVLDSFKLKGEAIKYTFHSLFKNMKFKDNGQKREWEKNRNLTFEGSRKHFLSCLFYANFPLTDKFEVYDIQTDSWKIFPDLPFALHLNCVLWKDKIFAFGESIFRDHIYQFDFKTCEWTTFNSNHQKTKLDAVVSCSDKIFVLGLPTVIAEPSFVYVQYLEPSLSYDQEIVANMNKVEMENELDVNINQNSNPPTASYFPEKVNHEFFSPFKEQNRKKFVTIKNRIIGRYGDYRSSPLVGHRHAGIDLKGDFKEKVFPIGVGKVVQVFRSFPHKTVVVKHCLANGDSIYSSYTHIEDIEIEIDDWVNFDTPLARLFTNEELELSDFGTLNHVHLEIRKGIEDGGRASWQSKTMDELNEYCLDPYQFFKQHLK